MIIIFFIKSKLPSSSNHFSNLRFILNVVDRRVLIIVDTNYFFVKSLKFIR